MLRAGAFDHLALANPELAPYGAAAFLAYLHGPEARAVLARFGYGG